MGVVWPARMRQRPRTRRNLPRWLDPIWRLAAQGTGGIAAPTSARETRFDALFQRRERELYAYLYRLTGDRQTASDLTQETFLRAWQHFDKIGGYTEPEGWLFRVATNLALNERRHRAIVGSHAPLPEDQGSASSDPAWHVAERDAVLSTLLALPAHMRAALILREVHGLAFDEVARALGITHAAAKMTLTRARERFRLAYLEVVSAGHSQGEGRA